MSDRKAIQDGVPFPAGTSIPFALWVRTSLRQQFADVVAEPVPKELIDILFPTGTHNEDGIPPAQTATPAQETAREEPATAPGSEERKIRVDAG
ncbi:hypothetical protein [Novacetimonas cocois]|uniref:Uncharacterized protein n=1 Tax=Novacetimonas cocois TaxID=1747507 RepID=A0A365Z3B2_9PROT|nr:hypothetical protein [Novacetimonas cocois]RBM09748.1 hypothetical protein NJLHNGOC_01635 [Novacetimonas cocois]